MKIRQKIEKIVNVNSDNFHIVLKYSGNKIITVDLSPLFLNPRGLVTEILSGQLFDLPKYHGLKGDLKHQLTLLEL